MKLKSKFIQKIAKNGVLGVLFVFSSNVYSAVQPNIASQARTIDTFLTELPAHADQKLVSILHTFLCDFSVKGHFSKFVTVLIVFLKDETNAAQLKSKFPTINIPSIIAMLEKVKNDTYSAKVVYKLRNYMNLFPDELKAMFPPEIQNMGKIAFTMCISKRLNDKS